MNIQIISTFYNSLFDKSRQDILNFDLSHEQLNKYTLKEYAKHINKWNDKDDNIIKMSFCFDLLPEDAKKYRMTKDLFSNNGKIYFEYNKTSNELIIL